MTIESKANVTEAENEKGLSYVIRDGISSQILTTLVSGAFLIAFALELGASNIIIGLLASIAAFAQLLQLPAIYLIEKIRNRKKIVFIFAALSRSMLLLLIIIPFISNKAIGITLLLLGLVLFHGLGAVGGSAWNSWMKDLIPQKTMGAFFSKRMKISLIFGIAVSLLASFFLDYWVESTTYSPVFSYVILFGIGMLAGMTGLLFVSKIPDVEIEVRKDKLRLLQLFKKPFKDLNFRNLLVFVSSWSFAINLAQPFFIVYMVQLLGYSMKSIIFLMLLQQMVTVVFLSMWGKYVDKFSNKSVMSICGPLIILSILGWTFTTLPEVHKFTLPLVIILHIAAGIAGAGIMVANGNISLKLAPKGEAASYLATNSALTSISAGIAPIVGGLMADFFSTRALTWTLTYTTPTKLMQLPTLNLTQWDFFFFFAFIIGVYALHRLSLVREEGEVDKKKVMDELFSDFRSQSLTLTSFQGMRRTISTPVALVANVSLTSVRQVVKLPKQILKKIRRK